MHNFCQVSHFLGRGDLQGFEQGRVTERPVWLEQKEGSGGGVERAGPECKPAVGALAAAQVRASGQGQG